MRQVGSNRLYKGDGCAIKYTSDKSSKTFTHFALLYATVMV